MLTWGSPTLFSLTWPRRLSPATNGDLALFLAFYAQINSGFSCHSEPAPDVPLPADISALSSTPLVSCSIHVTSGMTPLYGIPPQDAALFREAFFKHPELFDTTGSKVLNSVYAFLRQFVRSSRLSQVALVEEELAALSYF